MKHMISINLTDEIGVKRDVFPWVYSYILWLYCVVFGLGAKAADPQTTTHLLHLLRNDFDFWGAFIVKFNVNLILNTETMRGYSTTPLIWTSWDIEFGSG